MMLSFNPFKAKPTSFAEVQTKKMKLIARGWHDVAGGFGDAAIIIPLILSLSLQHPSVWFSYFFSAGIIYILSSLFFRIPIPVQPLKSIAVTALTMGASISEIRWAGCLLGLSMTIFVLFRIDLGLRKVPIVFVHGMQASLGVLLLIQGGKMFLRLDEQIELWVVAFCVFGIFYSYHRGRNLLGFIAVICVIGSMRFFPQPISAFQVETESQRFYIIMALVLPQIALTLGNSVIGTSNLAQAYYPEKAGRVTEKNLMLFIGIGNFITASLGGLPFCHGAGGLTAHYYAGARSKWATIIFGTFLLILALMSLMVGVSIKVYSPILSTLLLVTGFFHFRLAKNSLYQFEKLLVVAAMALTTLMTQDLLKSLFSGALIYGASYFMMSKDKHVAPQNQTQSVPASLERPNHNEMML